MKTLDNMQWATYILHNIIEFNMHYKEFPGIILAKSLISRVINCL